MALLTLFLTAGTAYDMGFRENAVFLFFILCFFVCVFVFFYFSLKVIHLFWRSLNHALVPEAALHSDGSLHRGSNINFRIRQIHM